LWLGAIDPVFGHFLTLEPAEIERVRSFGQVRRYGEGEALFRSGETGHGLRAVTSFSVTAILAAAVSVAFGFPPGVA
jgi:hypothetical protein